MPLSFIKYILFQWKVNELKWADLFFFHVFEVNSCFLEKKRNTWGKKEKSIANLENAITSYKLVVGKWQSNLKQKDENFVAFPVSPYSIVLWVKPYVCVQEDKRSSYFFNIYSHEADD